MANEEHLKILKQGVDVWNQWRKENPYIQPNLDEVYLKGTKLRGINLYRAYLRWAYLSGLDLREADLNEANLTGATLYKADLRGVKNLKAAYLGGANLWEANFSGAKLIKTDLRCAHLVKTNFEKANLTNCLIYGISAWDLKLEYAKQSDLVITLPKEPTITVDNLEVAQFIYLLLNNERIRHVIDTITSTVVLILGRFTDERKKVLDAIKEELRKHDYLPVMFDFEKPASRDLTETISTLARLSRFIVVDITDPRSVPQELQAIVPDLPSVPVQPILHASANEYGMFEHFKKYPWVLEIYRYDNHENLLASLETEVIIPAEAKVKELRKEGI